MSKISEVLLNASLRLDNLSVTPRLDVEVLLAHILLKPRSYLFAHQDTCLTIQELKEFEILLAKRLAGCPIAYLTKLREFWSLPLKVNENTLIPRPETELIVELTLNALKNHRNAEVLDLGTGCGAIVLALASEKADWHFFAVDISTKALIVAKENATFLNLKNIYFVAADWLQAISSKKKFDVIVANPPYLSLDDPHLITDLRFEPSIALISTKNGLAAIENIILQSVSHLKTDGRLFIEHGYTQHKEVALLFKKYGYQDIKSVLDLQGHFRVTMGRR